MKLSKKYNCANVGEIDTLISAARRMTTVIRNISLDKGRNPEKISDDPLTQLNYLQSYLKEISAISFEIDTLLAMGQKKLEPFHEAETDIMTLEEAREIAAQ